MLILKKKLSQSNLITPSLRCLAYSIFILVMLFTDNVYNLSDVNMAATFILFSVTFELFISSMKDRCRKFINTIIVGLMLITGLTLIHKCHKVKHDTYNQNREHFIQNKS